MKKPRKEWQGRKEREVRMKRRKGSRTGQNRQVEELTGRRKCDGGDRTQERSEKHQQNEQKKEEKRKAFHYHDIEIILHLQSP